MKKWNVLHTGKKIKVEKELKYKEIIKILLKNRGLVDQSEVEKFLHPKLENVTIDEVEIDTKELKKAIERISLAIEKNEKIIIFGDYDVDGICGTAILWETIYSQYKNVSPYIPGRFEEGYGLSVKGIDNVLTKYPDTKLIITVDNGIVAYEPVEYAKSKGLDVIITDHHVKGEEKLQYHALVHTTKLCGTGVAWLLSQEIKEKIFKKKDSDKEEYLDLVSLATVADLVPLNTANRTLVKFGLEKLSHTKRIGLKELLTIAHVDKKKIGVYEIGHIIGPRLNAAGRLFTAMDALRLICTKDPAKAKVLAGNLHATNRERQTITEETTTHAKLASITENISKIVFVHHESYNEGIIGLVASRLVEHYYRPSFVISRGEKVSKGSARSVSGINIIEMIRSVSEYILQAGGHPMAAGFTVETHRIEEFKKALEQRAQELVTEEHLYRELKIDLELDFSDVNSDLLEALEDLSPFGMGNPEPVFVSRGVNIHEIRPVGADARHLKFVLSQDCDGKTFKHSCIAFGVGERISEFKVGDKVDIAYTIAEDTWMSHKNASKKLQLKIKDIKNVEVT